MSDEQTTPEPQPPASAPPADSGEDLGSKSWAERQGKGEGPDYSGLAQRVPMDPGKSDA